MICNATAPDIGLRFPVDTQSGLMHAATYPGQFDARLESSTARLAGIGASGCCRVKTKTSWGPSQSGNPGGRRSVTKALREAGFDPDSLCAEVIKKTVEGFRTLDPGDKDEGQSWRWCMDKAWVLVNLPAKPVEAPTETTLTDEEYQEELDIIAKERVARMTPEEKFKLLSQDPATNDTLQ